MLLRNVTQMLRLNIALSVSELCLKRSRELSQNNRKDNVLGWFQNTKMLRFYRSSAATILFEQIQGDGGQMGH